MGKLTNDWGKTKRTRIFLKVRYCRISFFFFQDFHILSTHDLMPGFIKIFRPVGCSFYKIQYFSFNYKLTLFLQKIKQPL